MTNQAGQPALRAHTVKKLLFSSRHSICYKLSIEVLIFEGAPYELYNPEDWQC